MESLAFLTCGKLRLPSAYLRGENLVRVPVKVPELNGVMCDYLAGANLIKIRAVLHQRLSAAPMS